MEDAVQCPQSENINFALRAYQQWDHQNRLLFLTSFHTKCCQCSVIEMLSQSFEGLASAPKLPDTFFQVDVEWIINQWEGWNEEDRSQFITAIRCIDQPLFRLVFQCQQ
ncbi:hypothetical protein TrispH2_009227 [Trichoplax sp. H2]|nr:hypothetical protein TrispH2_009227 [Trichoplax sp. H2]|eukprot:RDD40167.1 hypothetical protein TrispH2_009227 [Trichoplax sp. H2]